MNAGDAHLDPLRRIGEVVADRYRITSLIGEGGMGWVYLADHIHLQERVVVKFLHPQLSNDLAFRERFRREAKALIRLHHPGIVTIHDFGEHGSEPYIALEYLEGLTLGQVINQDPPLPTRIVFQIFDQLLDVLAATHAAGIIHRDLKPENVMVLHGPEGPVRIRVLDFGIARIGPDEEPGNAKLTATGTIFGTPSYMAPEQCRGVGVVPESDVYSATVMLFFALTRRLPFLGESAADLFAQQLHVSPPTLAERGAPADLPVGLETLVARGLAKDPAQRPTATAFRTALQAIVTGQHDESRDADAMLRRRAMASLSRDERYATLLAEKTTPRGAPVEPALKQPDEAAAVLLWGFAPSRADVLKQAFAVNGIAVTVATKREGPDGRGATDQATPVGPYDAVVVSGENWVAHLAALPLQPARPPIVVIDVLAASEIPALVRAGASDVALFTLPVDALASKLRRLIQRSRPNPC